MEKGSERIVEANAARSPPPLANRSSTMLPPSPPQSSHGSFEGSFTDTESGFGLTTEKIERLGRVKPECFKSLWSEVGFVLSVCMAQLLTVCDILPLLELYFAHVPSQKNVLGVYVAQNRIAHLFPTPHPVGKQPTTR